MVSVFGYLVSINCFSLIFRKVSQISFAFQRDSFVFLFWNFAFPYKETLTLNTVTCITSNTSCFHLFALLQAFLVNSTCNLLEPALKMINSANYNIITYFLVQNTVFFDLLITHTKSINPSYFFNPTRLPFCVTSRIRDTVAYKWLKELRDLVALRAIPMTVVGFRIWVRGEAAELIRADPLLK
jgi:hypothetical protein